MPFPLWLGPAITGILGTAGQLWTNKKNDDQAKRQMDFQERMSSTAVRRSVDDYRAAGLNPGLAYERSASSPSGASAQIGNAIESGISNARTYATTRQQMELAQRQIELDERRVAATEQGTGAQINRDSAQANNIAAQTNNLNETQGWLRAQQPHHLRLAGAQALLTANNAELAGLQIPGAQNQARWDRTTGLLGPGISSAGGLIRTANDLKNMFTPRIRGLNSPKTSATPDKSRFDNSISDEAWLQQRFPNRWRN